MRTSLDVDRTQWPEVWKAAYKIIEQNLIPQQVQAWIDPLQFHSIEKLNGSYKVRLQVRTDFQAKWAREHHGKTLEDAFSQVMGGPCAVEISADEAQSAPTSSSSDWALQSPVSAPSDLTAGDGGERVSAAGFSPSGKSNRSSGLVISTGTRGGADGNLDPRYGFDSFVVGSSNQFAHASAVSVAEQPGGSYNPLFIYSAPGLGKTHLLHAIGNHLLTRHPNARVAYLSAEKFVNELIESIQRQKMSQFRAKYRDSYDLILIDDIQFIAGKGSSEEEFFHTFNALYSSKRQIILTCDRPPKEIEGLEERIRTRFEWGLVADIRPPEIETRIAILKAKAERDDIYLPDEVATFLATYVRSNVRELEGALVKLQAHASLTGAEISIEMAKQELRNAVPEESAQYTVESIQAAVAKHFHLKSHDLKAATRARKVAVPRQIAMYLIRKYTGIGFKEIGHHFGGKDHSTIVHACKKIEVEMETDPQLRDSVEAIQNLL